MMTLELDDETADVLNDLAEQQHLSPAQLVKTALFEYLEDCQDTKRAEAAYQRYLDSGKTSHNLDDVVKAFGLDS
jgi:predicted transcriptional regulator